jgi:hypothetical protein
MNKCYSSVRLYGFGNNPMEKSLPIESELYTDELYLKRTPYDVSVLLEHIAMYVNIPFELNDIKMYIVDRDFQQEECHKCDVDDVLPAGKVLNLIHKSFCKYKITLQSPTVSSITVVHNMKSVIEILNKHLPNYTLANVVELYWNGKIKKLVTEQVRKRQLNPVPNSVLIDYNTDIRNHRKTFDMNIHSILKHRLKL